VPGWYATAIDDGAVPFLVALGIAAFAACALRGRWRIGVGLALDFWLASGLLALGLTSDWRAILIAATIIGIRHAAMWALNRDRAPRAVRHG